MGTTIKPKQEQYDYFVGHLRKQNKRARMYVQGQGMIGQLKTKDLDNPERTLYDPIGSILPDWAYLPEFDAEGYTATHPLIRYVIKSQGFSPELAFKFQKIHDTKPVSQWENEFRCLAVIEKVIYTSLTNDVVKISKPKVVGYLISGRFHCLVCATKPTWPKRVKIYDLHVGPYSQVCFKCKRIVVEGYLSDKNEPLCLF